ncbi:MAG: hypothetical protein IKQ10_01995 [Oscillospiraceae bacterium]|nr:hypothetical protein [Oscillospiraceae bacterium]
MPQVLNVNTALRLFKIALGVNHDKRDEYFVPLLLSSAAELRARGCALNLDEIEDSMLLADYAEFHYRNRDGDKVIPRNLELRIRNRQTQGRAGND